MDAKREAAAKAITLIQAGTTVGLGAGSTMAYMVELLADKRQELNCTFYSSSQTTRDLLLQHGFKANDIASLSFLDIYFDGCDQFDKSLNALKSGGGIHTMEKLLASMAKEFVLVGDDSKYVEHLTTQYPLVLEILPQALNFVINTVNTLFKDIRIIVRQNKASGKNVSTENGNYLADIWFASLPDLSGINLSFKAITGVVETSLFYKMANKAIIAGKGGVSVIDRNH